MPYAPDPKPNAFALIWLTERRPQLWFQCFDEENEAAALDQGRKLTQAPGIIEVVVVNMLTTDRTYLKRDEPLDEPFDDDDSDDNYDSDEQQEFVEEEVLDELDRIAGKTLPELRAMGYVTYDRAAFEAALRDTDQ